MFYLWSTSSIISSTQTCDWWFSFSSHPVFFYFFFLTALRHLPEALSFAWRSHVWLIWLAREKCHNRVEIGLCWDWTRGLDETHQGVSPGQRKANEGPPYGEVIPVSVEDMTPALKTELQLTKDSARQRHNIKQVKRETSRVQMWTTENLWRLVITFHMKLELSTPPFPSEHTEKL